MWTETEWKLFRGWQRKQHFLELNFVQSLFFSRFAIWRSKHFERKNEQEKHTFFCRSLFVISFRYRHSDIEKLEYDFQSALFLCTHALALLSYAILCNFQHWRIKWFWHKFDEYRLHKEEKLRLVTLQLLAGTSQANFPLTISWEDSCWFRWDWIRR